MGDHHPRNSARHANESYSFNYAQGKSGTETKIIFHCFRRLYDQAIIRYLQRSDRFSSGLLIALGRETNSNNELCLGVRFALRILFNAHIKHGYA